MTTCLRRLAVPLIALLTALLPAVGTAAEAQAASRAPALSGDELWGARYNGPGNDNDATFAIGVSPDGSRIFVTGHSTGTTSGLDYETIAYDAVSGSRLWGARYNGSANGNDYPQALAVSPDGSKVFVTGYSYEGSFPTYDYATIAYNAATGSHLWTAIYNAGSWSDQANAIAVSPDGTGVFVTGYSWVSEFRNAEAATLAYDPLTGSQLWEARYNGGAGDDAAYALAVSPDSAHVYITGSSSDDFNTISYNTADGTVAWGVRFNSGNGWENANLITVSPDGSKLFVAGSSPAPASSDTDYVTICYAAATGAGIWADRYKGPGGGFDFPYGLQASPDGSKVFITGSSSGAGSDYDVATIGYDAATGTRLWGQRYNGPANGSDGGSALGVSPDGSRVFVTGDSEGVTSSTDFLTLAYDASTGVRQWTSRYNGPGNGFDSGYRLVVSPLNTAVFVTGHSEGLTSGSDYTTIAYVP